MQKKKKKQNLPKHKYKLTHTDTAFGFVGGASCTRREAEFNTPLIHLFILDIPALVLIGWLSGTGV